MKPVPLTITVKGAAPGVAGRVLGLRPEMVAPGASTVMLKVTMIVDGGVVPETIDTVPVST